MRATPRVVTGQTQTTGGDGYATLTLVPNGQFPQPRNGFNVQFFIKAYREGDPSARRDRGLQPRAGSARELVDPRRTTRERRGGSGAAPRRSAAVCSPAIEGMSGSTAQSKGATVDQDRIEGKEKELEGETQQKWGEAKDKARDAWDDVKDKADDVADEVEDRWDGRDEQKDPLAGQSESR